MLIQQYKICSTIIFFTIAIIPRFFATIYFEKDSKISCPGNYSFCPSETTCCKLDATHYGCCPIPDAVCCQDNYHCCPQNTICKLEEGICLKGKIRIPLYQNYLNNLNSHIQKVQTKSKYFSTKLIGQKTAIQTPILINSNFELFSNSNNNLKIENKTFLEHSKKKQNSKLCLNSKICFTEKTCCLTKHDNYTCLSIKNAVCCEDNIHYCLENTKCNLTDGKCYLNNKVSHTWLKHTEKTINLIPSIKTKISYFKCNLNTFKNDSFYCNEFSTCCSIFNNDTLEHSCCPVLNGVCCSDGKNCCPNSYSCHLSTNSCVSNESTKSTFRINLIKTKKAKVKVITSLNNVNKILCPDNSQCDEGNQCCPAFYFFNKITKYRCCPILKT